MSLVRHRYRTDMLGKPCPVDLVVEREWLDSARDAEALVAAARGVAAEIEAEARRQAERILEEARAEAAERQAMLARDTELAVWAKAAELTGALATARRELVDTLEASLADLGRELLMNLAEQVPEPVRLAATVRSLLLPFREEADAILYLHPDDLSLFEALEQRLPWTLASDAKLERSACRLESPMGLARAAFSGRVEAMAAALGQAGSREAEAVGVQTEPSEPSTA